MKTMELTMQGKGLDEEQARMDGAIDEALRRVPPLWPLRHFVAVNPFLGLTDQPFTKACAMLIRATGASPLQSADEYLAALESGVIRSEDLEAVADGEWTLARLVEALYRARRTLPGSPIQTETDRLDARRSKSHWGEFVVGEISKWCAAVFDENQVMWAWPWRGMGLYEGWREAARHDANPESFGLAGFRSFVKGLPPDATGCIRHCLAILRPTGVDPADYLHRQLSTIPGWAGHVQYRVREDAMRGRENGGLRDLLAIRLAYDAALKRMNPGESQQAETGSERLSDAGEMLEALARWQTAYELGYQRRLGTAMAAKGQPARPHDSFQRPSFQAVFCIDVRSEIFRRHLEATDPGCRTVGFAGFFGFPVAHRETAGGVEGMRSPVLLVPPVESVEEGEGCLRARVGWADASHWRAVQGAAIAAFSYVEVAGVALGMGLGLGKGGKKSPVCERVRPRLLDASVGVRADLAEGALRNMGLTRDFARLVLICGHGGESANNPHRSSLDCGACGGHAGDVNARLAAEALNDVAVRELLACRGVVIPDDTRFVPGLHRTATDEVVLFDTEGCEASHRGELAKLRTMLTEAGRRTRRERAQRLGLSELSDDGLLEALWQRAEDGSQVRPEWALANNAALVAAPRARTVGMNLEGRVFLHDYDPESDPDDRILTLILSAPVVVASWINLQYYASRVDPERYGSGNKALHQVVGGVGVFEGNGGDLRAGLPMQSIHDGRGFVHEPRRLAVYIEATPSRLDRVLEGLPAVRALFDHGWIHLWALDGDKCWHRTGGGWRRE